MSSKFHIPLHKPLLDEDEIRQAGKVINDGELGPEGKALFSFEKELRRFTDSPGIALVQSGTAALHLILKIAGIQPDDIVLLPTHTYIATANPLLYEGAEPVFVDIETGTYNMSPEYLVEAIEDLIKNKRFPKAVILVHLYGMPAKIKEIQEITRHYDLILIEDAAESFGSFYEGRHTGTFGDFGFLSFNANKVITTGNGGAILSRNTAAIRKAQFLARQAREEMPYYFHQALGYNYAMHNLQAALGIVQMKKAHRILNQKRKIHAFYDDALKDLPVKLLKKPDHTLPNFWLNLVLTEADTAGKIIRFLENKGIEARHVWYPLHQMPLYNKFKYYGNNETLALFKSGLILPSGPGLTEEELEYIIRQLRTFFR